MEISIPLEDDDEDLTKRFHQELNSLVFKVYSILDDGNDHSAPFWCIQGNCVCYSYLILVLLAFNISRSTTISANLPNWIHRKILLNEKFSFWTSETVLWLITETCVHWSEIQTFYISLDLVFYLKLIDKINICWLKCKSSYWYVCDQSCSICSSTVIWIYLNSI